MGASPDGAPASQSGLLNYFSIWNIFGLQPRTVQTKVPFIRDLTAERNHLFVLLTETWLREQKEAEIKVEGYTPFRADRKRPRKRRGRDSGGVCIYLRNDYVINTKEVLNFSNGVIEILGLYNEAKNLLIVGFYRQPDDVKGGNRSRTIEFKQALDKLRSLLSSLKSPLPDILLCGDFNLPHASWPDCIPTEGCSREERDMIEELRSIITENFLSQYILTPTHKKGNILDLCFTNNPNLLHSYETSDSILSDHKIVECATTYDTSFSEKARTAEAPREKESEENFDNLNFFNDSIDWESIKKRFRNHNWKAEFRGISPEKMLNRFLSICYSYTSDLVPPKARARLSHRKIPRERYNLMRNRRRINNQLQKAHSESRKDKLNNKLRDIEKNLQQSYKNSRDYNEHKAVGAIKTNSKFFYTYAKTFSSVKVGIGPLIDCAKNVISCPVKMAEMLSQQYSKVFSTPSIPLEAASKVFPGIGNDKPRLLDIPFDMDDIIAAIEEIPQSSASGPDRFPVLLLKNCKSELAVPLYYIWRRSLDTGEIPQLLKTAHIVPIHKGGSKGAPAQYRPVALTSHLIKLFEKVVRKYIVSFMEENNLFNPTQHGFRSGRSCLSQLLAHFDFITQQLEKGHNVDVVYLDFSKAFDKVDFMVTMQKLRELGIDGVVGRWIHAFLTNRTQSVKVDGRRSKPADVKSGVPQGSVLGPLLFLVLIGDIDQDVKSAFVSSFADDTRAAHAIDGEINVQELQSDLESIYCWADKNNMFFNEGKFECMRYGNDLSVKRDTHYTTKSGDVIESPDHVKDLGVWMSNDGTFKHHISELIKKSNNMCGWILRTFRTRDRAPMMELWKSLVRSHIDYCCQLWNPSRAGLIQDIEHIQRSFIRKVEGMKQLSYWEQLEALSLYSLERRRERYCIMYVWRILEGITPNFARPDAGGIKALFNKRRGRSCDIPPVNRHASTAMQNIRDASFAVVGPKLFNSLPKELRNLTSCPLKTFKRELDRFLKTVPDEPRIRGYTQYCRAESNSLTHMVRLRNVGTMTWSGRATATE